jgi:hypothetical protein
VGAGETRGRNFSVECHHRVTTMSPYRKCRRDVLVEATARKQSLPMVIELMIAVHEISSVRPRVDVSC